MSLTSYRAAPPRAKGKRRPSLGEARRSSEQVPKKLTDFFEKDLLQLVDIERFLFDRTIPCDREAL
jgi:hypothetical protein